MFLSPCVCFRVRPHSLSVSQHVGEVRLEVKSSEHVVILYKKILPLLVLSWWMFSQCLLCVWTHCCLHLAVISVIYSTHWSVGVRFTLADTLACLHSLACFNEFRYAFPHTVLPPCIIFPQFVCVCFFFSGWICRRPFPFTKQLTSCNLCLIRFS